MRDIVSPLSGFGSPFGQRRRGPSGPSASGGTETVIQDGANFYRVHTFTEGGTLTVTQGGLVEFLVVGGGSGGGGAGARGAAGGAGGGLRKWVSGEANNSEAGPLALAAGDTAVVVGEGSAGVSASGVSDPGGPSSVAGLVSEGGGRAPGSTATGEISKDGGSGAGGNQTTENFEGGSGIPGQGHDGGDGTVSGAGGGGGGAGSPGGGASEIGADSSGGDAGFGLASAISGASTIYSPGGRGTGRGANGSTAPGYGNPGSGGNGNNDGNGAAGSDGIVILRYRITEAEYNEDVA